MTDTNDYCRQIETYLCRKNDGHLVRIVGPAFEQVRAWAERGVPLTIAFRGIDRYCERYYAKGSRRRPVRIEFCEDDVLDAFEDWRRAVGVAAGSGEAAEGADGGTGLEDAGSRRRPSLAAHVERALARLTAARGGQHSDTFQARLDAVIRELDRLTADARRARGEARGRIVERLAALDREVMEAARTEGGADVQARLEREAIDEIGPFASRMTPDAWRQATEAAHRRLVRESLALPVIAFE